MIAVAAVALPIWMFPAFTVRLPPVPVNVLVEVPVVENVAPAIVWLVDPTSSTAAPAVLLKVSAVAAGRRLAPPLKARVPAVIVVLPP